MVTYKISMLSMQGIFFARIKIYRKYIHKYWSLVIVLNQVSTGAMTKMSDIVSPLSLYPMLITDFLVSSNMDQELFCKIHSYASRSNDWGILFVSSLSSTLTFGITFEPFEIKTSYLHTSIIMPFCYTNIIYLITLTLTSKNHFSDFGATGGIAFHKHILL